MFERLRSHPAGLFWLFSTEFWERFGYYGMRALLMYYMTETLMFSVEKSGQIYGWFAGFVFLSPLVGGYIADRFIGQRNSILIGAVIMGLGYLTMALPGVSYFYTALGLVIIGNGFFKPNISNLVGQLYNEEKDESKRSDAFLIFYVGINLGALFSPLICGTLGAEISYNAGFVAAGIGMFIGLVIFYIGQKHLGNLGLKPDPNKRTAIENDERDKPLTKEEKDQIKVIFIISFFVIFFWSAFEQAGSSLALFAKHGTDRTITLLGLNWEFPASWFASVNPLFIVLLSPLFSRMWLGLRNKGIEPSTPVKMGFGLILAGLGFIIMMVASYFYEIGGPVSLLWLFAVFFIHTIGELCLSPVGLTVISRLSPLKFSSLMMGVWFAANFFANVIGGEFAGNYEKMNKITFFMIPVFTACGAGVVLLIFKNKIKALMHGID